MPEVIRVTGAREHNLKNINVEIPRNKLVVLTGISGSGKSSLAFDTIYAEGQRRYVESLSSYARQFLGTMKKPDVDLIEGLSPAISIDKKSTSHNPRSTVGTITEIYDYLRLLFARIGHPHCTNCGREVYRQSTDQISSNVLTMIQNLSRSSFKRPVRIIIYSPVVSDRKGEFKDLLDNLRGKGFTKVRIDGQIFSLSTDLVIIKTNKHSIEVVIDRITINKESLKEKKIKDLKRRISEGIEQATNLSAGLVVISEILDASFSFPENPKKYEDHLFSQRFACGYCNLSISEIEPRIFSFNSPHGACPKCSGIGIVLRVDPERVVSNNLSISEGGILPFARVIFSDTWYGRILLKVAKELLIDIRKPLKFCPKDKIDKLLYGTGEEVYEVEG